MQYNPSPMELIGRGSVGAPGLTSVHQNVIFTIGGTITNVLGNATYGEVNLPTINGYTGTSVFGKMIRPYYGRGGGAIPILANLFLAKPLIVSTGTGTVQDTAMLYIDAPMAETVIGANYAIKVDAGLCSLGGGLTVTGVSTMNGSATVGGTFSVVGGGTHSFSGAIAITNTGTTKLDLSNNDWVAATSGTKATFFTSATTGNTVFNIQALTTGGNTAGQMSLNPNGGNVGVGVASPTAKLHLAAGAAGVNTAPIKLTAGTLNSVTEPGAIEFDGTNLYFVTSGGVRKTITAA